MHNVHVNRLRASRPTDPLEEEMPELAQRATQGDALVLRDLERALAALPVAQRQVLLLVALEDLSYEETARVLDIPIGTVMSRLFRGRERLRTLLTGAPPAPVLKAVK